MEFQRTGHKLKGNHSNALPRYIIAWDTETLPHRIDKAGRRYSHSFRLGVAISARIVGTKPVGRTVRRITRLADFWRLLDKFTAINYTTWLVCHSALFDMVVSGMSEKVESAELVLEWPRSRRPKPTDKPEDKLSDALCVIESPPTIIGLKWSKTGGRVVVVDTLNYFQQPLSELGKACGKPKLPMPAFDESDEKWFTYCERDTEIVFDTFTNLLAWVRENDMGMFRYTAPSQAMAAYRHRFANINIYIHDNDDVKKLERQASFGGRSEVFRLGEIKEQVHHYDCNAMFPYVMLANNFPCCLNRFEMRSERIELLPDIDWARSVAEVELKTWDNLYPVRTDHGVLYPVGSFVTTLCGEELE